MKTKAENRKRHYTRSSSFVMALLFTILCGAAALSIGFFINYFAKGHFVHSTEAVLEAELNYILARNDFENLPSKEGRLYIFLDKEGKIPTQRTSSIKRFTEGVIVFNYPDDKSKYAAKIHTFENNRRLLIGFDITKISNDFRFMQWMGIISIGFIMLVVFVSYIISIFVVSGTNKIATTARAIIETGDLSRRLDIGSRWDDLGNMAVVLNLLLSRIEDLMKGVRQVSDNIAHDLRTPLTRIRNKIDDIRNEKDSQNLQELSDEADHLLSTFNALLRISRIEAEKQKSQFRTFDLRKLLQDVIEYYEPLAEEKNITLSSDLSECSFTGDCDLLFQAFANILDNAIKYTPENGDISCRLAHSGENIVAEITDSGSGVNDDELNRIFERFYRTEKCRSTSGTGLGLSLVGAVINLHDGKIKAENTNPGLKIITIL